jgi:acyl-CoA synthetase (AMP-forming)/AMP-acid ligase II
MVSGGAMRGSMRRAAPRRDDPIGWARRQYWWLRTLRRVFTSPLPEIDIPAITLPELVLAHASRLGDKAALIDGSDGGVLTYAQLADGVRRVAASLAQGGLGRGDVVGLLAPNSPAYALAFLGIARRGAIVTPIPSLATVDEIVRQLRTAGARLLVADRAFMERAAPAAAEAGMACLTVDDLVAGSPSAPPGAEAAPDDVVALPFSSGTTGLPKGVELTHRNLVANVLQIGAQLEVAEDEVLIGVLPFFHLYGLTVVLSLALSRGATIVTMPRWDLDAFLDLVERHRVTRAMLVPPIILALARDPRVTGRDLSSLRIIKSGAAPLDAALARAAAERIGAVIVQGYGMTEASPLTHVTADRDGMRDPGSIGPLVPNTQARLVDPGDGTDVAGGEPGELWVRGPQVMRGYLNDPAATAATVDADGWLHTGDVARADEAGWFTIVDRVKELIKVRGHAVAPAELEALLIGHPAVLDAAVVGMRDEEAGERPRAFVTLRQPIRGDELRAWVAEHVAPYKRLAEVTVVEAIPRSASGKILRRDLRGR